MRVWEKGNSVEINDEEKAMATGENGCCMSHSQVNIQNVSS